MRDEFGWERKSVLSVVVFNFYVAHDVYRMDGAPEGNIDQVINYLEREAESQASISHPYKRLHNLEEVCLNMYRQFEGQ